MKHRAREVSCAGCKKDLTARPELVTSLGHATKGLRAPSRVSITVAWSGEKANLPQETLHSLWLCVECAAHFTLTTTGVIIGVGDAEESKLLKLREECATLQRKLQLARERLNALAKAAMRAHEEAGE